MAWEAARRLAAGALDLAFPARCVGCGREGDPVCPKCRPALEARSHVPQGVPIGMPAELPEPLLQLEWCAPYSGLVRRALLALKYGGERRLAVPLGGAVASRWAQAGAGGDLLVPVPVHPERARQRGYDQAVLIAAAAARALGTTSVPVLARVRDTAPQFELDRADRAANVGGAFAVNHRLSDRLVRERWIVLVDDVVTTGATLAACAVALLDAGAFAVSAVTVARER